MGDLLVELDEVRVNDNHLIHFNGGYHYINGFRRIFINILASGRAHCRLDDRFGMFTGPKNYMYPKLRA